MNILFFINAAAATTTCGADSRSVTLNSTQLSALNGVLDAAGNLVTDLVADPLSQLVQACISLNVLDGTLGSIIGLG